MQKPRTGCAECWWRRQASSFPPTSLARWLRFWVWLLLSTSSVAVRTSLAQAPQDPVQFFRQNCTSCHTIGGGRLTGPDLKNVQQRKDPAWLARFIQDPDAMLQSGDSYAARLKEEARGVVMPKLQGISKPVAEALLDLIARESKLPRSQFSGVQVPDRPFTASDVAVGHEIFLGTRRLSNSAASCISCHCVRGVGSLGGGRLGPDLTRVYERLQGRKNLSAWLAGPATPTMQRVFRTRPLQSEEILGLVAFFEQSAKDGGEEDMHGPLGFALLGIGGAAVGLALLDAAWRRRFHGVRRWLVHQANRTR